MNIIVNVDKNWAIGYSGQLLFPISADLKRFAKFTTGKVVVMGRATLESLPGGKPLKNRENIVLSRSPSVSPVYENLSFCSSMADLRLLLASERFSCFASSDIFVIGGQSVYELLLSECDTAYITMVEKTAEKADSFFPNLNKLSEWRVEETSETFIENQIPYRYITYKK